MQSDEPFESTGLVEGESKLVNKKALEHNTFLEDKGLEKEREREMNLSESWEENQEEQEDGNCQGNSNQSPQNHYRAFQFFSKRLLVLRGQLHSQDNNPSCWQESAHRRVDPHTPKHMGHESPNRPTKLLTGPSLVHCQQQNDTP